MSTTSSKGKTLAGRGMVMLIFCVAMAGLMLAGAGMAARSIAAVGVMHPIMNPPRFTEAGPCPNCGMMVNMWARTRHAFTLAGEPVETCSIRCMADMAMRADARPADVKAALYLEPEKMVESGQAAYVIGSSAVGTMTMVSKIAFADRGAAEKFAAENGGEVAAFDAAFDRASKEVDMARAKISEKRRATGKIKEPAETDRCTTCGMMPAKYPAHRAQILAGGDSTFHFCSTHCLVEYLAKPADYLAKPPEAKFTWVTVYPEGDYDYAGGMYYVVGTGVMGPMGPEALPFRKKADAEAMAAKEGGRVKRFAELTAEMVGWGAPAGGGEK